MNKKSPIVAKSGSMLSALNMLSQASAIKDHLATPTSSKAGAQTAKFEHVVGMAKHLYKDISKSQPASAMRGSAKNNYETPALLNMVKMGKAISQKLNPAAQHNRGSDKTGTGDAGKTETARHRPSKEQAMNFAQQLQKLPRPGQGGGNILKETMQYGQKVQALTRSLMTPPAAKDSAENANRNRPAATPKAAAPEQHPFQAMGKEAAVQRMQTIMQTMHAPAHPVHKVMDVLSDFSKGKIDKDGLRNGISAIGAQLPGKAAGRAEKSGAGSFGTLPGIGAKDLQKQANGFAQLSLNNNASLIIAAHQAMSSKIATKLKESQKPASKSPGK